MRSFLERAKRAALGITETTASGLRADPITAYYDALEAHYLNSGVYDRLANVSDAGVEVAGTVALRSLRNPANRVSEFYAAKLAPSEWPEPEFAEEAQNPENTKDAIDKVRRWSNWDSEGRTSARQFAWAGDLFLKISTKEKDGEFVSVYKERIDPRYVRDFDTDERGFFTYLRISVPKTRRTGEDIDPYTQTEVWDKDEGTYVVYEHDPGIDEVSEMGDPVLEHSLAESSDGRDSFTGYDFIPVVHAKFRDVGKDRGLSAFGHCLGQIRECDRVATKLHEMLFPETTWVLERSGVGPDGNPLPPLVLEDDRGIDPLDELPEGKLWARGYDRTTFSAGDTVKVGKDRVARLPAGGTLQPVIPNRNMQPAIDALAEQVKNLEADLPETAYSKLRELELSGRAIRYSLDDVYSRFGEAFSNLSQAMVRAENMALTVGQVVGLEGFSAEEIGVFGESGEAFEHTYETPDPFPVTGADEGEADQAEATAFSLWKQVGGEPFKRYLLSHGYEEEEAERMSSEAGAAPTPSIGAVTSLVQRAIGGGADDGNPDPADPAPAG